MWILEGLATVADIVFFILDLFTESTEEERRKGLYCGLFAGGVLVLGMIACLWLT